MSSYDCCKSTKAELSKIDKLSEVLKLTSDTSRLKILCILRGGEHCVCELLEHVNLSQSLVSHHLKDLKVGGIVVDEKKGSYVYYKLTAEGNRIIKSIFAISEGGL